MKIAALGDAHVGRSYYPISEGGVNVRERDFEASFLACIDLALDQNPDLMIFLGDIFDFPRPSFRSFRTVQKGFFKIRQSGIPLIAISGNHDTPRLSGTESPYAALHDVFSEFGLVYRQAYEFFDFEGVRIHGIPQMLSEEETRAALIEAALNKSLDQVNLVITHPRIRELAPSHGDINEIELDAESIGGDLALLGHYHFSAKVKENMWYVGSTDTFSFADNPELPKGIGILDTDSPRFSHIALDGRRPMIDLGTIGALGLGSKDLEKIVYEQLKTVEEGSVARLRLDGVDPGAYRLVDSGLIREMSAHLLHLRLEPNFLSAAIEVDLPELESMPSKWERFVGQQDIDQSRRDEISRLGISYIRKAIEAS